MDSSYILPRFNPDILLNNFEPIEVQMSILGLPSSGSTYSTWYLFNNTQTQAHAPVAQ